MQISERFCLCKFLISGTLPSETGVLCLDSTSLCHGLEHSQKVILELTSSVSVPSVFHYSSIILFSFTVVLGRFNNHYAVMTKTKCPHFDKSEIAVFPIINIIPFFKST